MKKISFSRFSLEQRLTLTFLFTSALIFLINLYLYQGSNRAIERIDQVYDSNIQITTLADNLAEVQSRLSEYLQTKSSESLGSFYEAETTYQDHLSSISNAEVDTDTRIMLENIQGISESYFLICDKTLAAKRGRNVQKYRSGYDDAEELYGYLQSYLYSLNNLQLQKNSQNYSALRITLHSLEYISMLVLAFVTVINLVLILFAVRTAIEPLRRLSEQAGEISQGNFDVPEIEVVSEDEIGIVTRAFNEMVVSIRGYIDRLRESMEKESKMKERELLMDSHLKEAELKYLQAQINPHFLFNTLNAGAQLSMLENADRTYKYLQNVAAFFRTKTNREAQVTTLSDEIRLVDNYIYIINVRFSGSIAYEKNIDESLTNVSVPSMILQPIIENAINHGVRDIDWPAKITLSLYRTGNYITISIKDNGRGISQEQIEAFLQGKTTPRKKGDETNGVGLSNVVHRLRLFYESEDVFDITSAGENRGTEVLLYIPMP